MKEPHLIPPFVWAGRWYLVEGGEPDLEHQPVQIRPLTSAETRLLLTYLDNLLTEAWALITAP